LRIVVWRQSRNYMNMWATKKEVAVYLDGIDHSDDGP